MYVVLRWFKIYFRLAPHFASSQLHNLFHNVYTWWLSTVNALGGEQQRNSRYLPPFFFLQYEGLSCLLLGESNCFQTSLIKHASKANLVSLFQTPVNLLIINLVPFLIANLTSQGLYKGDIRGHGGSQTLF